MRAGVVLSACLICAACGDDGRSSPDAGAPPHFEIVSAGGDQIGLTPGEATALAVRLVQADGTAIAQAPTTWKLVGGGGGTAGSTIAAAMIATGDDGVAMQTLTAGPARVDFKVTVDSGDAATATFFVSVSASGFTDLEVTPVHAGARTDTGKVELRAYRGVVDCGALDPDALPPPDLAPREAPGFGEAMGWQMLPAGEAYTIVAWAEHAVSMRPIAFGCAAVVASQVAPGRLSLALAVADRPLAPAASSSVASSLDLATVAAAEASASIDRPWRTLACPVGAGQLALDALAAQSDAGVAAAIDNARGALGGDGCRAAVRGGQPSLDAKLDAAIAMGAFPSGAARTALVTARADLLGPLSIAATLAPAGPGRLDDALVSVTAAGQTIDLAASTRPVIAADAAWTIDASSTLHLGAHGFTARLGSALGAAFAAGPLSQANLAAGSIGTSMFASAKSGAASGCAAIDLIVCPAAGLAAGCTSTACAPAASSLDTSLTAWWRAIDGGPGSLDLTWTGTAHVADADGDLVVDDISAGLWSATLATSGAGTLTTTGTWTSTTIAH